MRARPAHLAMAMAMAMAVGESQVRLQPQGTRRGQTRVRPPCSCEQISRGGASQGKGSSAVDGVWMQRMMAANRPLFPLALVEAAGVSAGPVS